MTRLILRTLAVATMAAGLSVAFAKEELVIVPASNPQGHPLNTACKLLTPDEAVQILAAEPFVGWEVATSADGNATSCRFIVKGKTSTYAYFKLNLHDYGTVEAAKVAWAAEEADMHETIELYKREGGTAGGAVTHVPGFGDDALTFGNTGEALTILKGHYILEVNDVTYDHLTEAQVIQAANLVLPRL
jgi:hypothetical protein